MREQTDTASLITLALKRTLAGKFSCFCTLHRPPLDTEVSQGTSCLLCNSGLPGMCSIHANSAREAITKLCTLPLLAGENVGHAFVVPTVAASVDIVVHTATDRHGHRRIREIVGVPGRVEGDVVEVTDLFATRSDRLVRADGYPPHVERFESAGYQLATLLAGTADPLAGSAHRTA